MGFNYKINKDEGSAPKYSLSFIARWITVNIVVQYTKF